jgi:hypothetical protein
MPDKPERIWESITASKNVSNGQKTLLLSVQDCVGCESTLMADSVSRTHMSSTKATTAGTQKNPSRQALANARRDDCSAPSPHAEPECGSALPRRLRTFVIPLGLVAGRGIV